MNRKEKKSRSVEDGFECLVSIEQFMSIFSPSSNETKREKRADERERRTDEREKGMKERSVISI